MLTHVQKRKLLKFFVPSIKAHPNWPVIISEGDSWFSFPEHDNTIDHLDEFADRKISLLRLEASGDRALRIIGGKQKMRLAKYLRRFGVQALLFSGGGNDIVGADLLPLLNQHQEGMSWQGCINEETTRARFERLRSAYLDLVHLRNENQPDCKIYLHSYDRAIPSGEFVRAWGFKIGPWMKNNLEFKGIMDPGDQRRIIHELLRRFDEMIRRLAVDHANVIHVQTMGTLSENEWNDELHPTAGGFRKIAEKFRSELKKQFPATF